jgi:hypothetical protein
MSDPRDEVESGKYDLGLGDSGWNPGDTIPKKLSESDYLDELFGYVPEFDGVKEGEDD